jgi:DNA-binding NarL/FixJ family response regulator
MSRKKTRKKKPLSISKKQGKIRVLLVDDSKVFLDLEERWLSQDPRVEIVGRAESGQKAVEQVGHIRPDVVVMDVTMREMDGLEAAQHIKESAPNPPRIILLTVEISNTFKSAAKSLHVDGYLSKAQLSTKLLPLLLGFFPGLTETPTPTEASESV